MDQSEVMSIVQRMCNTQSAGCRSLNKSADARLLMNEFNISKSAKICEIPVDWDDMVSVMFTIPGDDNYYDLFAGIGYGDKQYHFEVSIAGKFVNGEFKFEDFDVVILPTDYFVNQSAFLL